MVEGENEDGAISAGLAERAPTDARVPRGLPRGAGKGARGGVRGWGWKLRTRVATPRERTGERASVRASERATKGISDGPALCSSSFLLLRSGWSRGPRYSFGLLRCFRGVHRLKKVADLRKLARSENPRAHAAFEKISGSRRFICHLIDRLEQFTEFVFHE